MSDFTLNNLAQNIYEANEKKGFYEDGDKLNAVVAQHAPELLEALKSMQTGQRIALITSEASEALEADRNQKTFEGWALDEDWREYLMTLPDDEFNDKFKEFVKDTKEDEVADILIRVLDLCGANKIDIDFHVQAKLRYNSLRPYKHGKTY